MFMDIPSPFPYKATVGIDWADQKHDVFVRFAKGDSYRRKIDSRPEAIQEWLLELRSACAEGKIAIALEQRRGALFYQLCTHLNWIDLSFQAGPKTIRSIVNCLKSWCERTLTDFVHISQNHRQNANSINTAGIAAVCWI